MHLDGVVDAGSEDGGAVGERERDGVGDQGNAERGALSGIPPALCHLCHDNDR